MILEKTIKQASQLLKNKNIISHELDAQVILSDIMKLQEIFLLLTVISKFLKIQSKNLTMQLEEELRESQLHI